MKSSFFLLNEYRNPICYLLKNVPCNAEEKIGLKRVCHSLSLTGSHSFLEPDDFFFFFSFFSQISLQSHGKQLAFSIGSSVTRWFLACSVSKTVILIDTRHWLTQHPSNPLLACLPGPERLESLGLCFPDAQQWGCRRVTTRLLWSPGWERPG